MHNHPYYATLLGILGEAPRLLHQNFAAFAGDIAMVDEYSGVVNSVEEGEVFAEQVGDASAVLLRNHGAIIVAPTVEEAAWKSALFERMCHMTYDALISERHARELDPSATRRDQGRSSTRTARSTTGTARAGASSRPSPTSSTDRRASGQRYRGSIRSA